VSARYQVPVSDPLLEDLAVWEQVEGLRLISVDGEWRPPGTGPSEVIAPVKLCTVEDDGAPPELAGKIVDVTLARDISGAVPRVLVDSRTVIN
jgi:hypothetical protein